MFSLFFFLDNLMFNRELDSNVVGCNNPPTIIAFPGMYGLMFVPNRRFKLKIMYKFQRSMTVSISSIKKIYKKKKYIIEQETFCSNYYVVLWRRMRNKPPSPSYMQIHVAAFMFVSGCMIGLYNAILKSIPTACRPSDA